jgi:dihydrolipoamide dehydrogenase
MSKTNEVKQADVVVIGAGPGGYVCAIRLAQLGRKVTVIEKGDVGGVCLNIGCIPSKALIHAGTTYSKIQHASEMGIKVKDVEVDLKKLMEWKGSVVKKLTGGVAQLLKANGCTTLQGEATFSGPRSLQIKTKDETFEMSFNDCVIATGSRPAPLRGFEVDQETILDSTGALSQNEIPESMLCIGGGYIGLELGTFYAKMGTEVTVAEASPSLLGMVDPELTRVVEKNLKKLGVDIHMNTFAKAGKRNKKGIEVELEKNGKKEIGHFEKVLVTIGRLPNTEKLGLENAGVKLEKGFIPVNAQRQTNIPNIYAIGDVTEQPLLAHKASKEGIVAAEVIAGRTSAYDVVAMPAVIFTDPEIATVGMSEAEAKEQGIEVRIGKFPFGANGRALSVSEPDGMVKMIGDAQTGRLLGVHIVGAEASNLIAEAALALEMGATVEDLALTVHAHPTLPETLMEAAEATLGHAIHIYQRSTEGRSKGASSKKSAEAQA